MARLLTLGFAVVHAAVAIVAYEIGLQNDRRRHRAQRSPASPIGLMLGLYALGLISRRVSQNRRRSSHSALASVVTCYVAFGTPHQRLLVHTRRQQHDRDCRASC